MLQRCTVVHTYPSTSVQLLGFDLIAAQSSQGARLRMQFLRLFDLACLATLLGSSCCHRPPLEVVPSLTRV